MPESPPGALTPTALVFPAPNGSARVPATSAPLPPRSLSITNLAYPADLQPVGAPASAISGALTPLPGCAEWFACETAVVSVLAGSPAAIAAGTAALIAHTAAEAAKGAALVGIAIRINISLGWNRYGDRNA